MALCDSVLPLAWTPEETLQTSEGLLFTKKGEILSTSHNWIFVVTTSFEGIRQRHDALLTQWSAVRATSAGFPQLWAQLEVTGTSVAESRTARHEFETFVSPTGNSKNRRFLIPLLTSIIGFFTGLSFSTDQTQILYKRLYRHNNPALRKIRIFSRRDCL